MTAAIDRDPTFDLRTRLDDLHQLLYTRGGIRPVNAAVEELAKLLLIRLAHHREPDMVVDGYGRLSDLISPAFARSQESTLPWKSAFSQVNCLDDLQGRLPNGDRQPVWPTDEPFRITRTDVLAEALDALGQIEFGPASSTLDPLGVAFDTFLQGRYDHAGGLGTYLTPASVAMMMSSIGFSLVGEIDLGLVGDPCCGTGRFLAAIVAHAATRMATTELREWITDRVVGADQSPASVAMARVNMLSYGAHHPHVFTVDDSITDERLDDWRGQFSLILTNPPFGDGKYDSADGIERTGWLLGMPVGRSRIDPAIAFVARCIDLLAPRGVAGIVLPDGVLQGPALRGALLDRNTLAADVAVEGVVSLPTATFAPSGTVAKTSVLFIRRGSSDRPTVFLGRANHVGHIVRAGATVPDPNGDDLPAIASHVVEQLSDARAHTSQSGLVATCDRAMLIALDASSVDAGGGAARAELVARGGGTFAEFLSVKKTKRVGLTPGLPFVSVLHLNELGAVAWHEAETNMPSTPGKLACAGDLIVSLLNPAKFRATVVPDRYPEVQISAEFGVYTSKLSPYATLALLQHPLVRAQLAPMGRGTSSSRRRIDAEELLDLVCPPWDEAWVETCAEDVEGWLTSVASASSALHGIFNRD